MTRRFCASAERAVPKTASPASAASERRSKLRDDERITAPLGSNRGVTSRGTEIPHPRHEHSRSTRSREASTSRRLNRTFWKLALAPDYEKKRTASASGLGPQASRPRIRLQGT